MDYHSGDIIKVTVTSIENYGIFVMVDEEYNGMIHISEMSDSFVSNVRNFAFPGETIYAKVIDVDNDKYQIKLSIKSIDYRLTNKKGRLNESPNGFNKLKEQLPIWIETKLKEINC
jgi:predicted RNA-binding protein with RPS1 domain